MEAKLVVVGGDAQARQYDLRLPAIIGRSRTTDLTLGHPLVSRQHCEVFEADGTMMVRDLNSLNGTYVGETRISDEAMPVRPGDLLTVGPVTFRAVYHQPAGGRARESTWDAGGETLDAPIPGQRKESQDISDRPQGSECSPNDVPQGRADR